MRERELARKHEDSEVARHITVERGGDLVIARRCLDVGRLLELGHEQVRLLNGVGAAELLPEPSGDRNRKLHETVPAREVIHELSGEEAVLGELAVAALGARGDAAQMPLHVALGLAVVERQLRLREVGAAHLEVEGVENGVEHTEHGLPSCLEQVSRIPQTGGRGATLPPPHREGSWQGRSHRRPRSALRCPPPRRRQAPRSQTAPARRPRPRRSRARCSRCGR